MHLVVYYENGKFGALCLLLIFWQTLEKSLDITLQLSDCVAKCSKEGAFQMALCNRSLECLAGIIDFILSTLSIDRSSLVGKPMHHNKHPSTEQNLGLWTPLIVPVRLDVADGDGRLQPLSSNDLLADLLSSGIWQRFVK
jgi:hypothetical protein